MGIFDGYRRTLRDTTYATFGVAADWIDAGSANPSPVTVRLMAPDVEQTFGHSRAVVATAMIRVRASEVAAPAEGDQVQTWTDDTRTQVAAQYRIIADPQMLDPHGLEWTCEAAPVA
jgi:hypothetical protein